MRRSSTPSSVAVALCLAAGCAHARPQPPATELTFSPRHTAFDVVAAFKYSGDGPGVGLLLPTKNRWNALTGVAALGRFYLGDSFAVVAGPGLFVMPDGRRSPLKSGATLALVRVTLDASLAQYSWYDRIEEVVEVPSGADLDAVLDDARARCTEFLTANAGPLSQALAQAGVDTPGRPLAAEIETDVEVFVPSWTSAGVVAVCGQRRDRKSETVSYGPERGCGRSGPGEAVPPCQQPLPSMTTTTRAYAAAVAVVLRYRATGEFVAADTFAAVAAPGPAPLPFTR